MGFGVWGLGFGVWGLRFAVCGLRFGAFDAFDAFDALDALDAFGASDGAVAPACRGNRIAPAIAHHRAPPRTDALPARCRPRIRATTPPCGPRGPDGEKQRKLDGNPAHAKRAPAAAAIHVRSLSITRPMPGWCETSRRGCIGARAPMRTAHAYPGMRALADRRRIGHRSTPRRPRARHGSGARSTRSARASPHHRFAARRRPSPSPAARTRGAPITSARPPRPKPAGARRGRPGSRADQGNAFVPSNAATANPETFVSWSGEPG
ncbi:30S ribosomal S20 domain protein [Burkholderia pseudomallei]|nr:30S ribosomal S20 domain protein [Burkholderia pseudomallei]